MSKIPPKKAAETPMAAALLSITLAKHSRRTGDSAAKKQACELEKTARASETMPKPVY